MFSALNIPQYPYISYYFYKLYSHNNLLKQFVICVRRRELITNSISQNYNVDNSHCKLVDKNDILENVTRQLLNTIQIDFIT